MHNGFDSIINEITDYVLNTTITSDEAYQTAHYCLFDSLGCAMLALRYPECCKHLGPIVPGTVVPGGSRVPGTDHVLDPVKGAFDIGTLIRWLDFNDTWLAAEWGHPSDNLGAILAVADYLNRHHRLQQKRLLYVHDILTAMIKAHEIQGILALENSFNQVGLDHIVLVKVASTAVVTHLLGGCKQEIMNALSQAWIDGQSLRTYRHAPNTGSRKSWAAGDATSRAVRLALMSVKGEMGYPTALSAKTWGFYDVLFGGHTFKLPQKLGSYVMENVLFKIAFPAEFHAQTAVECAIKLHNDVKHRFNEIKTISIRTQEPAMRIISKTGELHNPADRDHCLEYMIAIGLIFGELTADHYENTIASYPLIDELRKKMHVSEDEQFTKDYYDPNKRAIPNAIKVEFLNGEETDWVQVDYPIGHKRRRDEGIPLLLEKAQKNLATRFSHKPLEQMMKLMHDPEPLKGLAVDEFMDLMVL